MKRIETSIIINQKKEKIWEKLMDLSAYGNWNPFIKSIVGTGKEGSYLQVKIKPKGQKPMTFSPVVLENDKNTTFRWKGKLIVSGLMDGEHYFKLQPLANGKTKFVHGENFTGLLSTLLYWLIKKNTRAGFISMNQALKQQSEN